MLKVKELIDDRNLLIKKEDCEIVNKYILKLIQRKTRLISRLLFFKIYYLFLHFHL